MVKDLKQQLSVPMYGLHSIDHQVRIHLILKNYIEISIISEL